LTKIRKSFLLRVGAACFIQGELIGLRGSKGWSCPTIRKNKWEDNWEQYWFYAKIGFPSAESSGEISYPLAAKIEEFKHVTKADFCRTEPGYKECYSAFASAARVVSGRDLIEEYLAAMVWPLTRGWLPGSFSKVRVAGLKDRLPFPVFGLKKPEDFSDDMIIEEIEQEAIAIASPYLMKERDSFEAICLEKIRVNRSFLKMGVVYGPREAPRERKRGASISVPPSPPRRFPRVRPPRRPKRLKPLELNLRRFRKLLLRKLRGFLRSNLHQGGVKEPRVKGIIPYGHSFRIAKEDLGSDVFMRELQATESSVPWRSRIGARVHLYLEQFGSFRAELDTTGAALLVVQRRAKASFRVVNLLDEESDEDSPLSLAKVSPVKEVEHPPPKMSSRRYYLRSVMMKRGRGIGFLRVKPRVQVGGAPLCVLRRIQLLC